MATNQSIGEHFTAFWNWAVNLTSAERLLTGKAKRANGGDVILLRSLIITVEVGLLLCFVITLYRWTPRWTFSPSVSGLGAASQDFLYIYWSTFVSGLKKVHWAGAILASVYAALYARFAAQWRYLADVYNKIKETEVKEAKNLESDFPQLRVMQGWRAGFLEDAEDLHLATKPTFATIIHFWTDDDPPNWEKVLSPEELGRVGKEFATHTPGGISRYVRLKRAVEGAYDRQLRKWEARGRA